MGSITFEELAALAAQSEGGFDEDRPLPEGEHRVTVKAAKAKQSAGGHPSISVLFQGVDGDEKGAVIWDNLTFSDNPTAVKIAMGKLWALGIAAKGTVDFDALADALKGQSAKIKVGPQKSGKYAGKLQVQSVSEGDAPGVPNVAAAPKSGLSF